MNNPLTGSQEIRVTLSISGIFALRMLGLFMILPVFTLYAQGGAYGEVSGWMIGLAMGIYGLTQAGLQIPFGILSDRYGRKIMIGVGLLIFAIGSILAALADDIVTVIIGRALQGAGAVASVLLALVADLIPGDRRVRAMAVVGMSIGSAFFLSLLLGPILYQSISVPGIFWLTAILALCGFLLLLSVPSPRVLSNSRQVTRESFFATLKNPQLAQIDFGVFSLHAIMTALFVAVPLVLVRTGVGIEQHGSVYFGVVLTSLLIMLPMVIMAEKHKKTGVVYPLAILMIFVSMLAMSFLDDQFWVLAAMLAVYFGGFNTLEALLPALISRKVDTSMRGTAMGVYSSAQFLGAFCGGVLGGGLISLFSSNSVFIGCAVLSLVWLAVHLRCSK